MKSIRLLIACLFSISFVSVFAQVKTDSFTVYGNCGMCKSRIEKAAKVDGVTEAVWNKDTKVLTVTYESSKVTNETIQKKVVAVGHDTELYTASEKVYEKLHGCCKYDRKGEAKKN